MLLISEHQAIPSSVHQTSSSSTHQTSSASIIRQALRQRIRQALRQCIKQVSSVHSIVSALSTIISASIRQLLRFFFVSAFNQRASGNSFVPPSSVHSISEHQATFFFSASDKFPRVRNHQTSSLEFAIIRQVLSSQQQMSSQQRSSQQSQQTSLYISAK